MSTTRARATDTGGAAFRLEPSPYGDRQRRADWQARIDALTGLDAAVEALQQWRRDHWDDVIDDQDDLWIEARLEEQVAVLRFDAMSAERIRTETLTGERVEEVCGDYLRTADTPGIDGPALEALARKFRQRYKPPIMPSSPFMRTEVELAERLMRVRDLDWYGQTIEELRITRGVVVHKRGAR